MEIVDGRVVFSSEEYSQVKSTIFLSKGLFLHIISCAMLFLQENKQFEEFYTYSRLRDTILDSDVEDYMVAFVGSEVDVRKK